MERSKGKGTCILSHNLLKKGPLQYGGGPPLGTFQGKGDMYTLP